MGLFLITLLLLIACMISATMGSNFTCNEAERKALLKFHQSFIDKSNLLGSWVGEDCCGWNGVGCDNFTHNVVKLDLSLESLHSYLFNSGALPSYILNLEAREVNPALLELKYLSHLDLSGIIFHESRIPEFLGSMRQLQKLYLSFTSFSGKVPNALGNLTQLVVLDLEFACPYCEFEDNNLEWVSKLEKLKYLDLSGIDLSLAIDSLNIFYKLPQLSYLAMSDCRLGNSHLFITDSTVSSSHIHHLDLSYNLFSGTIPHFIQNLSFISFLDLSNNHLNSPIPSWLGNKVDLEYLSLANNHFNGSFPHFIQNLSSLTSLDLSYNQFSSSIPSWLGNNRFLNSLSLGNNQFNRVDGGIMNIVGSLCSLTHLDLSHNQLEEMVPKVHANFSRCRTYALEFLDLNNNNISSNFIITGRLLSLSILDLSHNNLEIVPPSLEGFSSLNLRVLDLSYNHLKLVPPSFGNLSSLQDLDLSHNDLETLPPSFKGLSSLDHLRLSHNHFRVVSPIIGNLLSLQVLDLSHNNLETIHPSLGGLSSLAHLDLSYNHLSIIHQVSLANLSSLRYLDISSNSLILDFSHDWLPPFQLEIFHILPCKLNSPFPKWILSQQRISELDLSDTGIFGPLPYNIGKAMPSLWSLRLANNDINGSIPISLCELASLEVLDMKKNRLSGMIPNCWVNSPILGLELSSNKLVGSIPNSLTKIATLQLLTLNNNSLEGELPLSWPNNAQLTVLDVGKNNLHGEIPPWNGANFPSLQILILRENKFNGAIPSQLCSIHTLQIIDLATNILGGKIPQCFGHFQSMGFIASPPSPIANFPLPPDEALSPTIDPKDWNAVEVIKGEEREYTTVLHLLVNMDLSCNNLVGVIPAEITSLSHLVGLNLSHNHLMGIIPKEIGKMKRLESLDLSYNNLSGSIPESISSLNYLSTMNLSFNNLQGKIPTGSQLQVLDDPSIYMGNQNLCGDPLPKKCHAAHPPSIMVFEGEEEDDKHEKMWFYMVIMLGFATGFWGVIVFLHVKRNWRHAYFRVAEEIADWLYVRVAVWIAQIKGGR